jgi:hypothetical protein
MPELQGRPQEACWTCNDPAIICAFDLIDLDGRDVGASYFEAWERPDGIVKIPRQKHDKPIEMVVAVRKRSSEL